ncbi:MAG TPA: hypothetical protein DDW71_11240 [Lactobacillus sp.]|nr:hypothetical protein [Lactobacillus sp.]
MKKGLMLIGLLCVTFLTACGSNSAKTHGHKTADAVVPIKQLTTKTNQGYPVISGVKNSVRLKPGKIDSQAKIDKYLKNRLFLEMDGSKSAIKEAMADDDVYDSLVTQGILFDSKNKEHTFVDIADELEDGDMTLTYNYYPNSISPSRVELKWNQQTKTIMKIEHGDDTDDSVATSYKGKILPDGTINMYLVGTYNGYKGNNPLSVSILKLDNDYRYVALNSQKYHYKFLNE